MVNHEDYQKLKKKKEEDQKQIEDVDEDEDDLNDEIFEQDFQELSEEEVELFQK